MYVCMYVCTCAHTPMNPYFMVHVPVLQEEESGEIIFYLKGADTVMQSIVQYNDWLEEEVWKISKGTKQICLWVSQLWEIMKYRKCDELHCFIKCTRSRFFIFPDVACFFQKYHTFVILTVNRSTQNSKLCAMGHDFKGV